MIEPKHTQAQIETWKLKEEVWAEVAHLPLLEACRETRRRGAEMIDALGLRHLVRDPRMWREPDAEDPDSSAV